MAPFISKINIVPKLSCIKKSKFMKIYIKNDENKSLYLNMLNY